MTEQACPLCGNAAHYRLTQGPIGKRFACPTCIDFFIDGGAEKYLAGLPEVTRTERRQQLAKMAKGTPDGELLVIREPRHEESRTGIKNQTRVMIAEYVGT